MWLDMNPQAVPHDACKRLVQVRTVFVRVVAVLGLDQPHHSLRAPFRVSTDLGPGKSTLFAMQPEG